MDLEATSFRIGNFINLFGVDYNPGGPVVDRGEVEVVKVDLNVLKNIESFNYTTDFPYYERILLNDQWLIKFGFEYDEFSDVQYWHNGKLNLGVYGSGYCYFHTSDDIEIKYVDELQNLYFVIFKEDLKLLV